MNPGVYFIMLINRPTLLTGGREQPLTHAVLKHLLGIYCVLGFVVGINAKQGKTHWLCSLPSGGDT